MKTNPSSNDYRDTSDQSCVFRPLGPKRHARYHEPDIVYHVISRVFQGRMLLTPTPKLNAIFAGVVARAQGQYKGVQLYAISVMSNHIHLMLKGPPDQIPDFMGFIKREVSVRWGRHHQDWHKGMWEPYASTALPTLEDQERCLCYIMAQGVKEHLVARPEQWDGIQCAKQLAYGFPLEGIWVDFTKHGKALYKYREKLKENPGQKIQRPCPSKAQSTHTVTLEPLPGWAYLTAKQRQAKALAMVEEIVREAEEERRTSAPAGKPKSVTGMTKVLEINPETIHLMPPPPWYPARKPRMVAWSSRRHSETRSYLERYWQFQEAFRLASDRFLDGDLTTQFPEGAFRPMSFAGKSTLNRPRRRQA